MNNYKFLVNKDKPVLILSHPFATDISYWNDNVEALGKNFSLLIYDLRSHGKSPLDDEPYTGEILGGDVIHLMDVLKIKQAYFCGVSISGYIGQWLAINKPDRIMKVISCNSGYSTQNDFDQPRLSAMQEEVRKNGSTSITQGLLDFYFTPEFKKTNAHRVQQIKNVMDSTNKIALINCLYYVLGADYTKQLSTIKIPVLIIGATQDPTLTGEVGKFMNENIQGSRLEILKGAHAVNVEQPEAFNNLVYDFLK